MKKTFYTVLVIATLLCSLFTLGCKQDEETPPSHNDPEFLKGSWTDRGTKSFVINSDYSFVCTMSDIYLTVEGNLSYSGKGLGPNDYLLQNMVPVPADPIMAELIAPCQGKAVKITPIEGKTAFTLDAEHPAIKNFFRGTFSAVFLEGYTWQNAIQSKIFNIKANRDFTCTFLIPVPDSPPLSAELEGTLAYNTTGTNSGPNDYKLTGLQLTSNPANQYLPSQVTDMLTAFDNLIVTLKPSADRNTFTLTTRNDTTGYASIFLDDTFTKTP